MKHTKPLKRISKLSSRELNYSPISMQTSNIIQTITTPIHMATLS